MSVTIAVVGAACGGTDALPPTTPRPPRPIAAIDAGPPLLPVRPPDAAVPDAPDAHDLARGAACDARATCAAGLACLPWPGGYCASACDDTCAGADRACVELATGGARCLATCERDDDCRADAGYACDPLWHACTIPATTALAPPRCPLPAAIAARDPAFGAPRDAAPDALTTSPDAARAALADDPDCGDDACRDVTIARVAQRAVAIYGAFGGLRVRTSSDGGATYGRPQTPLLGARGDVAIAARDRVHVVGLVAGPAGAYGSAEQRVDLATSADGGRTFARPITISGGDDSIPYHLATPRLAVDERRDVVYVAYVRGGRRAIWEIVLAAGRRDRKTGALTFARVATLGDGCTLHALPALAVDDRTGTVHVAWYDARGEHGRFAHAACTPTPSGGLACRERGAISASFTSPLSTTPDGPRSLGTRSELAILRDGARRVLRATWREQTADGAHALVADAPLP